MDPMLHWTQVSFMTGDMALTNVKERRELKEETERRDFTEEAERRDVTEDGLGEVGRKTVLDVHVEFADLGDEEDGLGQAFVQESLLERGMATAIAEERRDIKEDGLGNFGRIKERKEDTLDADLAVDELADDWLGNATRSGSVKVDVEEQEKGETYARGRVSYGRCGDEASRRA